MGSMGDTCSIQTAPCGQDKIDRCVRGCATGAIHELDAKALLNHSLLTASRNNDVEGIRAALKQKAYLETRQPFICDHGLGKCEEAHRPRQKKERPTGLTPLMYVAQGGSIKCTQLLLEAKANVNAMDEEGLRPLHFAAGAGEMSICELLLQWGAERGAMDDQGRRAARHVPFDSFTTRHDRQQWERILREPLEAESVEAVQRSHGSSTPDLTQAYYPATSSDEDGFSRGA